MRARVEARSFGLRVEFTGASRGDNERTPRAGRSSLAGVKIDLRGTNGRDPLGIMSRFSDTGPPAKKEAR